MTALVIGIDGPAGSGKSTVARALAVRLGWTYLDTGSMYRAITVAAVRAGLDLNDAQALGQFADAAVLETGARVCVNGVDVTDDLRTDATNVGVSIVAAQPNVREAMVSRQRAFAAAESRGVVVEGRDITTVVFPDATLKVFLTASLEERSRRRGDESGDSVARRDEADMTRAASPLRQAQDAVAIDTTGLTVEEVVTEIVKCLPTSI
jgi:cytidylate kinase